MTSDCLAQAVHRQARDGGGALEHDGCMQVLTTAPSPPFPTGTSISPTCPSPSCASLRRWSRPRWASRRRRRRTSLPKIRWLVGWMDRVRVQLSRQTLGGEGRVPCRIRQVDWQAELGKAHVTGCPQRWQSGAWYRVTASAHVFRQVGRADHADSVSRFTFTAGSSGLGGEQQYAEGRLRMGVHSRGRMVLCIHSRLERPRGVNSSEIQSLGSTRRRVRQTGAVVVGARTT